jgi:hypothetical protein
MLISPLQLYEPKDWSGLTTENHLGMIYAQEPQLVSNLIERVFSANLGGDDVVSFLTKFPKLTIDDDRPYSWLLQGSDETNYTIVDYFNADMSTKPTLPGVARAPFVMIFNARAFEATDVIVGEKPELYKLRVIKDPERYGTGWAYTVQLVTGNDELSVPAADLTDTKWSKDYSLVEQTLSKRGGTVTHTSPFKMENTLSMIRKQYEVPGNMIRKGRNKPLAFSFMDANGKVQTQWIKKLDWDFLVQFRRERARLLLYGNSNKTVDGSYGNIGESGYEIRSGYGLYEQMAPSNIFYYNTFDIDWLTEIALGLSVGKLPEDKRHFVLSTGEYGMYQFHKAIESRATGWTPNQTESRFFGSGQNLGYGGQFTEYRTVNGLTFTLMHDPMKDDPVRNKLVHPEGGLYSSREYDLLDFGTANGEANIQLVGLDGDEEIFKYIPGLRDPYSPYNNLTAPGMTASPVDGYEVHKAFIGGIRIKNSMRTMRILPAI